MQTKQERLRSQFLEAIDKYLAEVEGPAHQPLGSIEQRLARIELAFREIERDEFLKNMRRTKPTK